MIVQTYPVKTISQSHSSVQFPGIYLATLDEEFLLIQPDTCVIREQLEGLHKSLLCHWGHSYGLDTMRLRRWQRR